MCVWGVNECWSSGRGLLPQERGEVAVMGEVVQVAVGDVNKTTSLAFKVGASLVWGTDKI